MKSLLFGIISIACPDMLNRTQRIKLESILRKQHTSRLATWWCELKTGGWPEDLLQFSEAPDATDNPIRERIMLEIYVRLGHVAHFLPFLVACINKLQHPKKFEEDWTQAYNEAKGG